MNRPREHGYSFYHNIKHKIMIGGGSPKDGIESYDVNKDEWSLIMDELPFCGTVKDMFINEEDPNIVFIMGSGVWEQWELHRIDLRMIMDERKTLLLKQDTYKFDADEFAVLRWSV